MEIWLDTSDVNIVTYANGLGFLEGVTTNPTIISLSQISPQELIMRLLEVQSGLVAVQVLSDHANEMYQQAKILSNLSPRILIKIPVTQKGIQALYALNQEGIPTLATAIFELRQALLAFKAGVKYLAPYLGRISDRGANSIEVISQIQLMKVNYGFEGKIMGAGIRDLDTAIACTKIGFLQ